MTAESLKKEVKQGKLYIIPAALRPHHQMQEEQADQPAEPLVNAPIETMLFARPIERVQNEHAVQPTEQLANTPMVTMPLATIETVENEHAVQPTEQLANTPMVTMPLATIETVEESTLSDVVKALKPISVDRKILLTIGRETFIEDTKKGFFRADVDWRSHTDVIFKGQWGVDNGGLTRQFKTELVQNLQNNMIFSGPENNKSLAYNAKSVDDKWYYQCGSLLAYLIAHGGPYPAFFSEKMVEELLELDPMYGVENIDDISIQQRVEELQHASSIDEFNRVVTRLEDIIAVAGAEDLVQLHKKDQLVDSIVSFWCKKRMAMPLQQFKEGLNTLNVLSTIQCNPHTSGVFFLHSKQPPITVLDFRRLWKPVFSDSMSNKHRDEARIHGYFMDLLMDLNDTQLKLLLQFATGQDTMPLHGFSPRPTLHFKFNSEFGTDFHLDANIAPTSNTCALELFLPVTENYDIFKTAMLGAIEMFSSMFTNA